MPMRIGTEMPPLEGATEWFNATGAHAAEETRGQTTLVHFWSVSCATCKENMPRVNQLRDAREAEGLRVVAVHMPRYEADTDAEAVRDAVAKYNITEPCAWITASVADAFQTIRVFPAYDVSTPRGSSADSPRARTA